ncbi:MAG: hypothetical protein VCB99_13045 [Myxococcota bacterium]
MPSRSYTGFPFPLLPAFFLDRGGRQPTGGLAEITFGRCGRFDVPPGDGPVAFAFPE